MCKEIFRKNKKILASLFAILSVLTFAVIITIWILPKEPFLHKPVIKKNIILGLSPAAQAKEYLIQVDDNPSFESPESIKRISGRKSRIVIGVESENKSYYWRIKPVTENDDKNSWQNRGELKESLPAVDLEILMDGEYYSTGKPINFYLFVRNRENSAKEFPYEISIESKEPAAESAARETHYILKGKIAVEANGYKLEKVEMIAEKNLEIGRVIYAVAKSGEQKAVETFEIVPAYGIQDIKTENLTKGKTGKVQLVVTNTSNSAIGEFKAKLSIDSSKLKVKDWFSEKVLRNFEPSKTETLEWEVEAYDTGYAQLVIAISSDGIPDKTGKLVEIGYEKALAVSVPEKVEIPLNQPFKLKIKVANLSVSPVIAFLKYYRDYSISEGELDVIKIDEIQKTVTLGPTSEMCVSHFEGPCSAEVEWEITGLRYGEEVYTIKADGFDMPGSGWGRIYVTEKGHKIAMTIDGNDKISEKIITKRGDPVSFDIEVKNLSNLLDRVAVDGWPNGTGWNTRLYDGDELIKTILYTVEIPPNSSHKFKLIVTSYESGDFTNPFTVNITAWSRIEHKLGQEVITAKVTFKE